MSATPLSAPDQANDRPRIGVPWRTHAEEIAGKRRHYNSYLDAIRNAGGEPIEISLSLPDHDLARLGESLDALVLPGSPADIDPGRYAATRHAKTANADPNRERTDAKLLDQAIATGKPVLAICYGLQLLNVHFGGTLVQDIPSEVRGDIDHDLDERPTEPLHAVRVEANGDSRLFEIVAQLSQHSEDAPDRRAEILVNSSHHQSICEPGRGLHVTARAPDGVIEAVEWSSAPIAESSSPPASESPAHPGGRKQIHVPGQHRGAEHDAGAAPRAAGAPPWIVGVQWHPERMPTDPLARALFQTLVSEARRVRDAAQHPPPPTGAPTPPPL
jgi:putative glutamine amidotransferase